jgi:cardiolipin synthase
MFGSSSAIAVFFFVHLCALFAAGHAVTYKRDSRSAATWVILIVFVPLVGTLLYFWIGINRVKRRARGLRGLRRAPEGEGIPIPPGSHAALEISGRINRLPLRAGNRVELLVNGEEAYPRMLKAIGEARRSLSLATYIFDNDSAGREFAAALVAASARGVAVRVLVDAVGSRYSFPSIFPRLKGEHLRAARFLDTIFPWRFHYSQLRNHRKILIADGELGFVGGMNIRAGHLVKTVGKDATQDFHFEVRGPVVHEIQRLFAEDWEFASGEALKGVRWTLLGAISVAQESVRILTPYFVPDQTLLQTLGLAVLRGVRVEIVLPEKGNVAMAQWACQSLLWQVLERGCHVFLTPGPFDHSKLFLIDDAWALVGSPNWDARSLRLNFEIGLELEDPAFVSTLSAAFALKRQSGREFTLQDADSRPWWGRLRDGTARLFSPYL